MLIISYINYREKQLHQNYITNTRTAKTQKKDIKLQNTEDNTCNDHDITIDDE